MGHHDAKRDLVLLFHSQSHFRYALFYIAKLRPNTPVPISEGIAHHLLPFTHKGNASLYKTIYNDIFYFPQLIYQLISSFCSFFRKPHTQNSQRMAPASEEVRAHALQVEEAEHCCNTCLVANSSISNFYWPFKLLSRLYTQIPDSNIPVAKRKLTAFSSAKYINKYTQPGDEVTH